MYTTPLSDGFYQGGHIHKHLRRSKKYRAIVAELFMDKLCGLAEALGAVPIEHLEHGLISPLGEAMSRHPDELLSLISKQLGFEVLAPNFQAGAYGLKTSRGFFTEREASSILIAKTVSDMVPDKNAPLCEIGGGGGSLAYYLWQFGFRNLTLIDLPTVNIAQAYFLHRNLPDCKLFLSGDENIFSKLQGIRVLSARHFSQAPDDYYALVVNVDSFPEISSDIVQDYLRQIRRNAKGFLSINQESASNLGTFTELIVREQVQLVGGFQRKYRCPYWLRKGYVEELYEIEKSRVNLNSADNL